MPKLRMTAAFLLSIGLALGAWSIGPAAAQELKFFRLGTGPVGEMHFNVGGLLANLMSNPPGSRECDRGGSCGVPGMIAVAQSTNGSIANVEAMGGKTLDGALAHADIAYWAFHGTGAYQGKGAITNLRGIAKVYTDSFHLVARKDAGIASVRDLRGKRVSLGEQGSGLMVHGGFLLKAYGLSEKDLKISRLKPGPAADALAAGNLDAFLLIDASPSRVVESLALRSDIVLIPITGPEVEKIRQTSPFLEQGQIPAGTYAGLNEAVATLDVGVVFLVRSDIPQELVYGITKALWHPSSQRVLANTLPQGKSIKLEADTDDLGIQLHGGAASYYFDTGVQH